MEPILQNSGFPPALGLHCLLHLFFSSAQPSSHNSNKNLMPIRRYPPNRHLRSRGRRVAGPTRRPVAALSWTYLPAHRSCTMETPAAPPQLKTGSLRMWKPDMAVVAAETAVGSSYSQARIDFQIKSSAFFFRLISMPF